MTTTLSSETKIRDITLRIVRHKSLEEMRSDVASIIAEDKEFGVKLIELSNDIDLIHAITLGQYIEKVPEITVFIPVMSKDLMSLAVPHESLHAALAILRHEYANSIDPSITMHIGEATGGLCEVSEETVCTIVGQISAWIYKCIDSIDSYKG